MTEISKNIFFEIKNKISIANNIIIISHKNPDGDAIGSLLAIYTACKKISNNVQAIVPNRLPHNYLWVDGVEKIKIASDDINFYSKMLIEADLVICTDFNDFKRVGDLSNALSSTMATKIIIDHHPDYKEKVDYAFIDTSVSSACELTYRFIKQLDANFLNRQIAEYLMIGITTDTGCFNYNSQSHGTFDTISELIKLGVDRQFQLEKIYNNFSYHRLKFLGFLLNKRMHYFPEYNFAYILLYRKEMLKNNFREGDTMDIVNYPLTVKDINVSCLFKEEDGLIKISFRSKNNFNVNNFAKKYFNGGGHVRAAGGKSNLPIEKAAKEFVKYMKLELEKTDKDKSI